MSDPAQQLDQLTDELVVDNDVMVPMRDGIRLRTDIFRPSGPGPYPVLVQRYPYTPHDGIMAMFGKMLARQGYAVLVQSCRGRYGSEGDFYPFHPDVDDSYDTVEWAAVQPWSNGRVGMYGMSYSGYTQWTAAIARPPHLVAIAPFTCTWNWDESTWYFAPGVLQLGLAVSWSALMSTQEAERRGMPAPVPQFAASEKLMSTGGLGDLSKFGEMARLEVEGTRALLDRRPLRDVEELRELAPWFRDWCDQDDARAPYWRRISAADHVQDIDLPVFHLAGWYDFFSKGGIDAYTTLTNQGATRRTREGQRLVIGPWNHNSTQVRPDADPSTGALVDFGPDAPVMRFFSHHLKGELPDYADEPRVRLYVMGDNVWREENEWPLARTEWTSYYLRGADSLRSLSPQPPGEEQADVFVYDPNDPVPGPVRLGATYGDAVDLDAVAHRPDVLVYTTPPLADELEVTGPVTLELWASSSVADTDFTAKLVDVFPDGTAVPVCQGIVRTGHGVTQPRTLGAAYRYEISLWSTSTVFQAGHRIRLDVSSSEYPTYEPNPNTGERITHASDAKTVTATQHVFHDALHPSRLVLPVIPR
ncbi:CocE/NonD family hydrolase [Streptomyces sp. NPDC090499]|uniref:CocE/NonD family hydrolase n=1 Tax=Streptomyces sp. NPDC090499 TaxID=3365965 RepID=UPI00381C2EB2